MQTCKLQVMSRRVGEQNFGNEAKAVVQANPNPRFSRTSSEQQHNPWKPSDWTKALRSNRVRKVTIMPKHNYLWRL